MSDYQNTYSLTKSASLTVLYKVLEKRIKHNYNYLAMLGTKEERKQWKVYQKFVKEHAAKPEMKYHHNTLLKYNKLYGYIWIPKQTTNLLL